MEYIVTVHFSDDRKPERFRAKEVRYSPAWITLVDEAGIETTIPVAKIDYFQRTPIIEIASRGE